MKKISLLITFLIVLNVNAQEVQKYGPTDNANPNNYIEFNSKMFYFVRNFGGLGFTLLYATDGTSTGNQLIKNLGYSASGDLNDENEFYTHKIIFKNKLYFVYDKRLWSTDGTADGTVLFNAVLGGVKYFKIYNDKLYFTAVTLANGSELWSTDGTVAGTQLVKDINPGVNASFYSVTQNPHFTVFNNKLFFVANDGVHGYELWSSDGTESGTTLFKDIRLIEGKGNGFGAFTSAYYMPYPFKVVGSKMYFGANPYHAAGGPNNDFIQTDNFILYETDGTVNGTKYVQPTPAFGKIYNYINLFGLTVYNNKLFIHGRIAFDDTISIAKSGIHLLDGTNPIRLLQEMYGVTGDVGTSDETDRYSMRYFDGNFYTLGYTNSTDRINLWKMNPNDYSFTQITKTPTNNLSEFSDSGIQLNLLVAQVINNRLHFVATRVGNGSIYSTDGTAIGNRLETKIRSPNLNSKLLRTSQIIPNTLFAFANSLFFKSDGNNLYQLNFSTLSNESFESKTLKIYPNPASIQINLSFADNVENASIKIISILGQTVLEKQNISGNNYSLDVSNLSSGTYVVQVKDGSSIGTSKFIKQ